MPRKNLDTRTDLVAELEKIEPRTPLIERIMADARSGEFHDFKNRKYAMPKLVLVERLREAGLESLATQVISGDYDEPAEESDKAELMSALRGSLIDRNPNPPKSPPIPRFQGKVGQATEPPEMQGKWFFTIWVSFLGHAEQSEQIGPIGPWETEAKAQEELQTAMKLSVEAYEQKMFGETSGEYVDMKTNVRRKWDDKTH